MVTKAIRPASRCLAVCYLLSSITGCGAHTNRADVTGSVRLDGQAVQSGSITFLPTAGNKGPTAGAVIVDGRYGIDAAKGPFLGANLVELHSSRKTGRKVPTPMLPDQLADEVLEVFPANCNATSQLVRQIVAGHNQIDFDIHSRDASTP